MKQTARESDRPPRAARRSAQEWAAEVAGWRKSGKTVREYAAEKGISPATLSWYASRGSRNGATGPESVAMPAFLPVRVAPRRRSVQSEESTRLRVEIALAGGRCVRVAGELSLDELARLLDVVDGGQRC